MVNPPPSPAFQADAYDAADGAAALPRWRAAAKPVRADVLLAGFASLGVVVPHADDETLGCGGLISAAADMGLAVTVTILTDGAASHPGSIEWPPQRLAAQRRDEAEAAVARLTAGVGRVVFGDAPDGRLAAHPGAARTIPPADLYVTCWRDDPHPDHKAAFAMARDAARRYAAPLLAFPLWTLTTDLPVPQLPVLRFDIGAGIARKRHALAAHRSQLGKLIADVGGFVLDPALCRLFVRRDELFVRAA